MVESLPASGKQHRLRRADLSDHELMRTTRLASLKDAPDAFSSKLDRARAMPESTWRARTDSNAAQAQTMCVLWAEENAVCAAGIAVGVRDQDLPTVAHLNGMWLSPEHRSTGVGARLVDEVIAWARERGCSTLVAGITPTNARAMAYYRRVGFGAALPAEVADDHAEVLLALPL